MSIRRFDILWLCQAFLHDLVLIFPVYAIMMQEAGVSPFELSLLFVIWSVSALLFEVPSGVVGDLVKRKYLLAAGEVARASGFLTWMLLPSFTGFACGFLLWSLGGSARSGTMQALLYDSLVAQGRPGAFARLYGWGRAATSLGVVVALGTGGYAAEQGYELPLALSVLAPLLTGAVVLLLPEPAKRCREEETPISEPRDRHADEHGFLAVLTAGIREVKGNRLLRRIAAMVALLACVAPTLEEYVGPVLHEVQSFSLTAIGLWYSLIWLAFTVGVAFAHRLGEWRLDRIALLYGVGAAVLVAGQLQGNLMMPLGFLLFFVVSGVGEVMLETRLQESIESTSRATVTSMASMVHDVSGVLLYLFVGVAATLWSWSIAFAVVGVGVVLAAISFAFLRTASGPPHAA